MARTPICMCNNCNNIGTHKIDIAKRGGRNGFMCDFHYSMEHGYSYKNNMTYGKRKVNGFTFGIELETSHTSAKARGELLNFGFVPTSDCSINGSEYKSPIFEGLNAISKQAVSFNQLIENNDMYIGEECGTHFHVGHADHINAETIEYIRRFYHSLFVPLSNAMKDTPEKVEKLFGRGFTYYASPVNSETMPNAHTNFINVQHNNTIEFRLCKFVSDTQYMHCVKFCKDIVNAVINNFVIHFNDEDYDRARYASKTEYRKHKAQVAAAKLVKLYEKYTANM